MAPKVEPSKKAVREKKKAIVEDLTFGLKNKNKSAKVQQFIKRTEDSVKKSHGGAEAMKNKETKEATKLAKQLQEEELRLLFNEGITGQTGKSKKAAGEMADKLGLLTTNDEIAEFLDAMSDDSDEDEIREMRKTIYLEDDAPANVEVFREKTIEDHIEEQRARLAAEGKVGTPVNEETFGIWRAAKQKKKQEDAEERLRLESLKKKGKGLSVLSGKELFNFNKSLFVDDDSALNVEEEKNIAVEFQQRQKEEDAREAIEMERVQAEQARLAEAQQLEIAARDFFEENRRKKARASDCERVELLGVLVNISVFEEDEEEDLNPFTEFQAVDLAALKDAIV